MCHLVPQPVVVDDLEGDGRGNAQCSQGNGFFPGEFRDLALAIDQAHASNDGCERVGLVPACNSPVCSATSVASRQVTDTFIGAQAASFQCGAAAPDQASKHAVTSHGSELAFLACFYRLQAGVCRGVARH